MHVVKCHPLRVAARHLVREQHDVDGVRQRRGPVVLAQRAQFLDRPEGQLRGGRGDVFHD
jgi:hypothetical protein